MNHWMIEIFLIFSNQTDHNQFGAGEPHFRVGDACDTAGGSSGTWPRGGGEISTGRQAWNGGNDTIGYSLVDDG